MKLLHFLTPLGISRAGQAFSDPPLGIFPSAGHILTPLSVCVPLWKMLTRAGKISADKNILYDRTQDDSKKFYKNVVRKNPNNPQQLQRDCMFCNKPIVSTGPTKFGGHLTSCALVPEVGPGNPVCRPCN